MNKEFFKRWSTAANGLSMFIAGVLVYIPDVVPSEHHAKVQMLCAGVISLCQFVKQEANSAN